MARAPVSSLGWQSRQDNFRQQHWATREPIAVLPQAFFANFTPDRTAQGICPEGQQNAPWNT